MKNGFYFLGLCICSVSYTHLKWLKQHLKIKKFWGTTENAVRIQISVAIITYSLVAIVQHDMNLKMCIRDRCQTPMVVDADALNLLGEKRNYIGRLPKGSILTPHPKELERLVGKCQNSYERLMKARELAKSAGVHIILKGAYSAIVTPAGKCFFNPTGNPGMATGGSGDVLTLSLIHISSVPEAMTELDISDTCFAAATDTDDYQAVAIGPGLGKAAETEAALLERCV